MRRILRTGMLVMSLAFAGWTAHGEAFTPRLSLVAILADPQKHEGQRVVTEGFVSFEFEGRAIYVSRESFEQGLDLNAVALSMTADDEKRFRACDRHYCLVEGTVLSRRGHLGLFSATLTSVSRMVRLPGP